MIPNEKSYCELDPRVKDKWGLPVLRFHWEFSEHELRQVAHMRRTFADLIEAMGGKPTDDPGRDPLEVIRPGGNVKHEVGGALMGDDPGKSVSTPFCRAWDVKNLFFADGAPFCSNADKNPTLTIMALAWRTADHVLEEMQRGNI
jgi:choline dehydrogenase-like flavoprotein